MTSKSLPGAEYVHLAAFRHGLRTLLTTNPGRELNARQLVLLLVVLFQDVEPTVRDLADHTQIPKSAVTRAVDGLAELGLVERIPVMDDKRVIRVQITAGGKAYLRQIEKSVAKAAPSNPRLLNRRQNSV